MALQLGVTVRNAFIDNIESTISTAPSFIVYSGAVPADCAAADPSGTLATITCPSDWLAAASGGAKAIAGSWTVAASGTGTPASWRIKAGATCHMQGTAAVGSGDVSFNGTITSGQTVTVTAFTLTAGNA